MSALPVVLVWGEFEHGAYVGLSRALGATKAGRRDTRPELKSTFAAHIEGAVAEVVVAKALGIYWPADLTPNRDHGDLVFRGTPLEVRFSNVTGLNVYRRDPDGTIGVLVRGTFPRFEVVGGYVLGEARQDRYWRGDLQYPCWTVPAADLRGVRP